MQNQNSNLGILSTMYMIIPVLVGHEGKEVDDILERILEIRKQPKELHAEMASDLVADISKKTVRDLMNSEVKADVGQ
ncbi:MAG: hypothetical protein IJW72_00395 [Alphaproteobacteria bacterium]|nr:hypothetical protein [Alphaproteobacteria bacterium]MBQ7284701.1 hypothetical protein [Alphaproteobacteria bacterium]